MNGNFGSEVKVILKVTFDLRKDNNVSNTNNERRRKTESKKILIEPTFLLTFRYVACVSTQNSSGEKIRRSSQVFKRGDLGFN